MKPDLLNEAVLTAVQQLEPIARGLGLTMAQLALAWVLRNPIVASAITGATRPEQVSENAKASGVTLRDDDWQRIEAIIRPVAIGRPS
jgi:aryl-alcohol dehydrogenase-like predicted oxidoreductase